MTFHQLEKVLARAATNRAFRDEIANGDADLDELGLSEDEQSVLNELVASSGAGLDAVLNVVTAVPTSAAAAPRGGQMSSSAARSQGGTPRHSGPPTLDESASTPAFALMTPPAQQHAQQHAQQPAGHPPAQQATLSTWHAAASVPTPMPATVPTGPAVSTVATGLAGQPRPAAGTAPATMAMETQGPAAPGQYVQGFPVVMMPYPQAVPGGYPLPYGQPVAAVQPAPVAHPTGVPPAGALPDSAAEGAARPGEGTRPHRSLDASDVGRPVVARLPFGMDVVK